MTQSDEMDDLLTLLNGHGSCADEPELYVKQEKEETELEEIIIFDFLNSLLSREEIYDYLLSSKKIYLKYFHIFDLPLDLYPYPPFRFGRIRVTPSTKLNIVKFISDYNLNNTNSNLILQFIAEIYDFKSKYLDDINPDFLNEMNSLQREIGNLSIMYGQLNEILKNKEKRVKIHIEITGEEPYEFEHPWIVFGQFIRGLNEKSTYEFEYYISKRSNSIPYHITGFDTDFRNKIILALYQFISTETEIQPVQGKKTSERQMYMISDFLELCGIPIMDKQNKPITDITSRVKTIRRTIRYPAERV
jgi:hypothetical protein